MSANVFHLAQLNIATLLAPLEDPLLAEFVANLDRINALAEAAPGFIWRLKGEGNDATSLRPFGEQVLVNMSVWASAELLFDFVYRTRHTAVMNKRRQWFAKPEGPYMVLWWDCRGQAADNRGGQRAAREAYARRAEPSCFHIQAALPAAPSVMLNSGSSSERWRPAAFGRADRPR
jgi:hypothetical protein